MNVITKLSPNRPTITLQDLIKPNLGKLEKRAIDNALKSAKKDQDKLICNPEKLRPKQLSIMTNIALAESAIIDRREP